MKKSNETIRKEGGSPIQNYDSIVDLLLKTGMFKEEKGKGVCKETLEEMLTENNPEPENKK